MEAELEKQKVSCLCKYIRIDVMGDVCASLLKYRRIGWCLCKYIYEFGA